MAATGQGAGQAGDAGQAQQGEAQQQQQGAPDYGALLGRVDALDSASQETRQALDQIAQSLQQAPWAQQEQGQEPQQDPGQQDPMDIDLGFLDPGDPNYDPQQAAQALTQQFGQMVERAVEQRVGPVQQQQEEQRRQWEAAQLTSEFPELADTDTANEVLGAAQQYAELLAPTIGQDVAGRLANEPSFWRLIYAAGRSFDAAAQEGSGDPGAAHLEGGGGANPAGGQQVDYGDLIVNGGEGAPLGRKALPFG